VTERAAPPATVRELDADEYRDAIPQLAALIVDAVDSGAGVNFLAGVTVDEAAGWWADRIDLVRRGVISAFVALDDGAIVASTILIRSTNPNSPHRAEIGKVLVLQSARRRGIATAVMDAAEARARADGRWMLMLDTVTGSAADALHKAGGDQQLLVRGQAAGQRGGGEQREADEEDPPTTDQVTEAAGEQQQAAERDQVAVDHPGERGLREAEVLLDRRQRDVHDRRVQDDHHEAGAEDEQRGPASVGLWGLRGVCLGHIGSSLYDGRRTLARSTTIVVQPFTFEEHVHPHRHASPTQPR